MFVVERSCVGSEDNFEDKQEKRLIFRESKIAQGREKNRRAAVLILVDAEKIMFNEMHQENIEKT